MTKKNYVTKNRATYFDKMERQHLQVKILILGYGEHGKDEFATRLKNTTGVEFMSSSAFAARKIIYPWFRDHMPDVYETADDCFNDRRNWRTLWYLLIKKYNTPDKSKLARGVMQFNDAYVGMRCTDELQTCIDENIFTHIFWVDAGDRVPPENVSSNNIHYNPNTMCMIDNSAGLSQLQEEVLMVAQILGITV